MGLCIVLNRWRWDLISVSVSVKLSVVISMIMSMSMARKWSRRAHSAYRSCLRISAVIIVERWPQHASMHRW